MAYMNCMTSITGVYCGKITSDVFTFFNEVLDEIYNGYKCDGYTSIFQCTHPFLLAVMIGVSNKLFSLLLMVLFFCGRSCLRYYG